jgi:excisionase family DNA binding protein
MLTVKQVAEQLGMSLGCVYGLIQSGKLPSHRIGVLSGRHRISVSDLAAFVEQSREEKQPTGPAAPMKQKPLSAFKHLKLEQSPDSVEQSNGQDTEPDADKSGPASTDRNGQAKSPPLSGQPRPLASE